MADHAPKTVCLHRRHSSEQVLDQRSDDRRKGVAIVNAKGASLWQRRQRSNVSRKVSSRARAFSQSLMVGSWPSEVGLCSAFFCWQRPA
jgi:hypothetical protein